MNARTKHGLNSAQQIELHNACAHLRKYRLKISAQLERDCNSPDSLNDVIAALDVLANAELIEEKPE